MSNARPVRFGALSLLALMVAICLATLAVLAWSTACASSKLADRQQERTQASCDLDARGQRWLAEVDGVLARAAAQSDPVAYLQTALPDGSTFTPAAVAEGGADGEGTGSAALGAVGSISATLEGDDGQQLAVSVSVDGDFTYTVTSWCNTVSWSPDTSIGGSLLGS